jgi:hypothetical protein
MPENITDGSLQFRELLPRSRSMTRGVAAGRLFSSIDIFRRNRTIPPAFVRRLLPSLTRSLQWLLASLILLVAAPVPAQDVSGSTGYRVRGVVVNSLTGQPVSHALVTLSSGYAMLAGADGQFVFDNIPGGQYMVTVQKPGFTGFGNPPGNMARLPGGAHRDQQIPPRPIQVGADMPDLTFPITPQGAVFGQITLSTADSPDGIRITLYRRIMQNGHPSWRADGRTRTRSDGSFRLDGLQPGAYMLSTEASMDNPGSSAIGRLPVWGYPPVYYPGVTDPGSAGILMLAPGQQTEADFTLTRQQFYPVAAAVRTFQPETANLSILDSGGRLTGFDVHYDARDQMARASVPNGTWTLDGHAFGPSMAWGRAEFQVAGVPVALAINLVPVPRIPVLIQRDFTSQSAQTSNSNPGVNLALAAADQTEANGGNGGGLMPVPGSGGTEWQLMVTEPGRFWVEATAFPPGYISSITSGGVDLASAPLVIAPGTSPSPIEITLRDDTGSIDGQISGSGPGATVSGQSPQVWIYAIPLFATSGTVPEGAMRPDGTFVIDDLAPGAYRVVACDTPQSIDFHSAEGLAAWSAKGQTVTVVAGGTANATVSILHAETAQ